jgi:uncharacterized membrane protein YdjX (TVP38/TMEM64 family)
VVYGRSGFWPLFLLFLLPGVPKDLLCYIAGLTPMHVVTFLFISAIGRFPGVVLSCILGEGLAERNWKMFGLSTGVTLVLLGIVYLFRVPLEHFRRTYLMTKEERNRLSIPSPRL